MIVLPVAMRPPTGDRASHDSERVGRFALLGFRAGSGNEAGWKIDVLGKVRGQKFILVR